MKIISTALVSASLLALTACGGGTKANTSTNSTNTTTTTETTVGENTTNSALPGVDTGNTAVVTNTTTTNTSTNSVTGENSSTTTTNSVTK